MKLIKVSEASARSGLTELYLRALLKQGVTWGDAVKMDGRERYSYKIYEVPFEKWMEERS